MTIAKLLHEAGLCHMVSFCLILRTPRVLPLKPKLILRESMALITLLTINAAPTTER